MLFYSWRKIQNKAGRSSKRILLILKAITFPKLPTSYRDPLYQYYLSDFSGSSFLVNPEELIKYNYKYTFKEVAQYIGLASYRSYSHYNVTGEKSLDLFHSPVGQDTINQNRLLRIHDDKIYFYYEEDINRRNKLWH